MSMQNTFATFFNVPSCTRARSSAVTIANASFTENRPSSIVYLDVQFTYLLYRFWKAVVPSSQQVVRLLLTLLYAAAIDMISLIRFCPLCPFGSTDWLINVSKAIGTYTAFQEISTRKNFYNFFTSTLPIGSQKLIFFVGNKIWYPRPHERLDCA